MTFHGSGTVVHRITDRAGLQFSVQSAGDTNRCFQPRRLILSGLSSVIARNPDVRDEHRMLSSPQMGEEELTEPWKEAL